MENIREINGYVVRVIRKKYTRFLCMTIQPDGMVRISANARTSDRNINRFIHQKNDWIMRTIQAYDAKIKVSRDQSPEQRLVAKNTLIPLVRTFAKEHNFHVNNVTIRNQKTRWGSCSSKNNINLNMQLIQLPTVLRNYVIFHELVHTRYHNHSQQFWKELGKYVPEARLRQKELNGYLLVK